MNIYFINFRNNDDTRLMRDIKFLEIYKKYLRVKSRISTLDNAINFREIKRYYMRENIIMLQQQHQQQTQYVYPPTYEQAQQQQQQQQQQHEEDDVEFEDALQ